MTIGVLHPGEMGAAVARQLTARGHEVLYASAGRSAQTRARAEWAGMTDATTVAALARDSAVVLSICPPHAARDVAAEVPAATGRRGLFVDANAVAPATARDIEATLAAAGGTTVDAGIIGPPPERPGTTRMYVSGPDADAVADLFAETVLDVRVVGAEVGLASAVKMCYAAWTKGTAALLLGIRAVATHEGVEAALLQEWAESQPALEGRSASAATAAYEKGWRWTGEMTEIAATFAAAGLPSGFHEAAAAVFERSPRPDSRRLPEPLLEHVVAGLRRSGDDDGRAEAAQVRPSS
jgi:3-hydroxyisobutyrate dehydrogenase-like beta-hydroxyacid dehydrogenase